MEDIQMDTTMRVMNVAHPEDADPNGVLPFEELLLLDENTPNTVANELIDYLCRLKDHFCSIKEKYIRTRDDSEEAPSQVHQPNIEDFILENPKISFIIFHAIRFSFFCAKSSVPAVINAGRVIITLIIQLHNYLGTQNFGILIASSVLYYNYSEFIHEAIYYGVGHWIKQFVIVRMQNFLWGMATTVDAYARDFAVDIINRALDFFIKENQHVLTDVVIAAAERGALVGAQQALTEQAKNQATNKFIQNIAEWAFSNPAALRTLTEGAKVFLLEGAMSGGKTRKRKKRSKKKKQKRRLKTKKRGKTKKRRKSKRRKSRNKK